MQKFIDQLKTIPLINSRSIPYDPSFFHLSRNQDEIPVPQYTSFPAPVLNKNLQRAFLTNYYNQKWMVFNKKLSVEFVPKTKKKYPKRTSRNSHNLSSNPE
jgi:hypothetical protein